MQLETKKLKKRFVEIIVPCDGLRTKKSINLDSSKITIPEVMRRSNLSFRISFNPLYIGFKVVLSCSTKIVQVLVTTIFISSFQHCCPVAQCMVAYQAERRIKYSNFYLHGNLMHKYLKYSYKEALIAKFC